MNKLSAAAKSEIIVQSCGIAALRELPRFRFPLSDFRFEFVRSQVSSFRFFFATLLSVFICENLWLSFRIPLSDFRFKFVRSQVSSFRFFFAALLSVFICENLWLKFPLTAFRFPVSGFRFQVLCFK